MLGPVDGGWLTDNYSWRWVFYINVPIEVLAMCRTQAFIFDPPICEKNRRESIIGGSGYCLGIGSLQIMLDKGQEDDWFSSHFILTLAGLAIIGLGGLIIRELKAEHPIMGSQRLPLPVIHHWHIHHDRCRLRALRQHGFCCRF
jgi:DHA2 family multidrug resistance protein